MIKKSEDLHAAEVDPLNLKTNIVENERQLLKLKAQCAEIKADFLLEKFNSKILDGFNIEGSKPVNLEHWRENWNPALFPRYVLGFKDNQVSIFYVISLSPKLARFETGNVSKLTALGIENATGKFIVNYEIEWRNDTHSPDNYVPEILKSRTHEFKTRDQTEIEFIPSKNSQFTEFSLKLAELSPEKRENINLFIGSIVRFWSRISHYKERLLTEPEKIKLVGLQSEIEKERANLENLRGSLK